MNILLRNILLVIACTFAFTSAPFVANAQTFSPTDASSALTQRAPNAKTIYRPSAGGWINVPIDGLQAQDVVLQGRQVLRIHRYDIAADQVKLEPMGEGSHASLARHAAAYDPRHFTRPHTDAEIVYTRASRADPWTFKQLGYLNEGATFFYHGREFRVHVQPDNSQIIEPTGNVFSTVVDTKTLLRDEVLRLTVLYPQAGEADDLVTTDNHPFWAPERQEWVRADELEIGEPLWTVDGTPAELQAAEIIANPTRVYNFAVAGAHTYYVATNNADLPPLLVHNENCWNQLPDGSSRTGTNEFGQETFKGPNGEDLYQGHDGRFYNQATNPATVRPGGLIPDQGNVTPSRPLPGFESPADNRLPDRGPNSTAKTHGVIDTPDGPVFLQSQVDGPGAAYRNPRKQANFDSATHVEGHAAALVRQNGLSELTVTINNRTGPCNSCLRSDGVPNILPPGAKLHVRWRDDDGILQTTTIIGSAS